MTDESLNKIEMLLAHQEKQIQDLSDMVIAQGREIEILTLRLERINAKLSKVENHTGADGEGLSVTEQAARDKPPHY